MWGQDSGAMGMGIGEQRARWAGDLEITEALLLPLSVIPSDHGDMY